MASMVPTDGPLRARRRLRRVIDAPMRGAVALAASLATVAGAATAPHTTGAGATVAFSGGTIYVSPTEAPIARGVVVVRDGRIIAVGPSDTVPLPGADTIVVDCAGRFLVAGFQNSHVHFTEPKWEGADKQPAAQLSLQLEDMLLRWGVTTVVDTGSLLANTQAIRTRIESGEVRGPRILTAGTPLYPENGIPYYLRETLPPAIIALLNTPKSGEEAARIAARQLEAGADVVKLFTGSWVERGKVLPMDASIARAAADEGHRRGKLVFAHASNVAGLESALVAGVDVLAHALDDDRGWNESHIARMKANRMSMVPTLKLFGGQSFTHYIQEEVGTYARAGGQILFGTDVGYLTDYDPTDEYVLMAGAGLDWRAILASLTTAPAERFGESARRGWIAPGMDADIVALAADPAVDVRAFAKIAITMRRGRVVYAMPLPAGSVSEAVGKRDNQPGG
jgi:imidazolonepropionase-like amidohydrolase